MPAGGHEGAPGRGAPWRWDGSRTFPTPEITREALRIAEAAEGRLLERACRSLHARRIQGAWRRCIADPAFAACRRRLTREFDGERGRGAVQAVI